MGIPVWAAFVAAFLICAAIWVVKYNSRPALKPRTTSEMSKAHYKQDCSTCFTNGVLDSTDPTRNLSIYDQMKTANQVTCDCCQGNGFHMMVRGTRKVCKVYAQNNHNS